MIHNSNRKVSPRPAPLPARKSFCEFFAGIGLVRAGLEGSGWECIYANDICPKKQAMYQGRYGEEEHFHLQDVWNTDEVLACIEGRPFLAAASFPCIDLSTAGHYQGLKGKHSSTFFAFTKILEDLGKRRPPMVMIENVPGFLTARKEKTSRRRSFTLPTSATGLTPSSSTPTTSFRRAGLGCS